MNTDEMRQATAVLERFSDEEREYHLYQARENATRIQLTNDAILEEALKKQKKLEQMLRDAGIDPDAANG